MTCRTFNDSFFLTFDVCGNIFSERLPHRTRHASRVYDLARVVLTYCTASDIRLSSSCDTTRIRPTHPNHISSRFHRIFPSYYLFYTPVRLALSDNIYQHKAAIVGPVQGYFSIVHSHTLNISDSQLAIHNSVPHRPRNRFKVYLLRKRRVTRFCPRDPCA